MAKSIKDRVMDTSIIDEANKKISKMFNIAEPVRPDKVSDFPKDVTSLSSESVGLLMSEYDAEVAYIRHILAQTELKYAHGKSILETYKKELFLRHRSTASNNDSLAWVEVDKDVKEASLEVSKLEAEYKLLQARLDIFTKYSSSISREITRRKSETWNQEPGGDQSRPAGTQEERLNSIRGKDITPKVPSKSKKA